ncbi:MAG: hypothetical protein ACLR7Z_01400 [Bilophila wadsworthia]
MQSEKAIGNGYHLQLMNGVLFVILFASAAYQLSSGITFLFWASVSSSWASCSA